MSSVAAAERRATAESRSGELLRLDGVSVAIGQGGRDVSILNGVDLAVVENETVGLVGESGSGKSMSCLTAAGLLASLGGRVTTGRVLVNGVDMTVAPESEWRRLRGSFVGYVFQQPIRSLNPAFTVGGQVAEVLRVKLGAGRREAWRGAVELLDRVHIANAAQRAHDYPHMMSGGMCQRVAIAIAIACRPKVLIADEPTTALDSSVEHEILLLLDELRRDLGLAILYVSHDLGVVGDISDRVVVLYAGEVVEEASSADLFRAPMHPYTRGLLGSTPTLEAKGRLAFIRGSVPPAGAYPPGCRFSPRCPWAAAECIAAPIPMTTRDGRSARCIRLDAVASEVP